MQARQQDSNCMVVTELDCHVLDADRHGEGIWCFPPVATATGPRMEGNEEQCVCDHSLEPFAHLHIPSLKHVLSLVWPNCHRPSKLEESFFMLPL